MADGFTRLAPKVHDDGVYINLPMADYVNDPAIGGHGALTLAASPCDFRWDRPDNALSKASRERETSEPRRLGELVHCATLEGLDTFERRYCCPPPKESHPEALDTVDDLKKFIRDARAAEEMRRGAKLGKDEAKAYALSGKREDFIDRVLTLEPKARIWDAIVEAHIGDREAISEDHDAYVRLVAQFARQAYGDLLRFADPSQARPEDEGLSEVSVFWRDFDEGPRFKARFDRITMARIIDVKKVGPAPKLQHSFRQHCVNEAAKFGYPVQAVMHSRAATVLPELVLQGRGEVVASGPNASAHIERLQEIAAHWWNKAGPLYTWLFLRCPGPPVGKPIPFRPSDAMWSRAEETIADAVANWERFHGTLGDALWMDAQAEEEIDLADWPNWSFASPSEDRG